MVPLEASSWLSTSPAGGAGGGAVANVVSVERPRPISHAPTPTSTTTTISTIQRALLEESSDELVVSPLDGAWVVAATVVVGAAVVVVAAVVAGASGVSPEATVDETALPSGLPSPPHPAAKPSVAITRTVATRNRLCRCMISFSNSGVVVRSRVSLRGGAFD